MGQSWIGFTRVVVDCPGVWRVPTCLATSAEIPGSGVGGPFDEVLVSRCRMVPESGKACGEQLL